MTRESMDPSDPRSDPPSTGWPILFALTVFLMWVASGLLIENFVDNRGTFGDMFGAINALFSGLAFAGVIYAILLQRSELQLQRRELQLTRIELAGQREQLTAQNVTLKRPELREHLLSAHAPSQ